MGLTDVVTTQHMDFEIDRQQITVLADEQPSLKEMCAAAAAREGARADDHNSQDKARARSPAQ